MRGGTETATREGKVGETDSVLEQASYNFPHKLRTYWLGEELKIDSSEDAGGPGAPDTTPRFRIFTRHTDFVL